MYSTWIISYIYNSPLPVAAHRLINVIKLNETKIDSIK